MSQTKKLASNSRHEAQMLIESLRYLPDKHREQQQVELAYTELAGFHA